MREYSITETDPIRMYTPASKVIADIEALMRRLVVQYEATGEDLDAIVERVKP